MWVRFPSGALLESLHSKDLFLPSRQDLPQTPNHSVNTTFNDQVQHQGPQVGDKKTKGCGIKNLQESSIVRDEIHDKDLFQLPGYPFTLKKSFDIEEITGMLPIQCCDDLTCKEIFK